MSRLIQILTEVLQNSTLHASTPHTDKYMKHTEIKSIFVLSR